MLAVLMVLPLMFSCKAQEKETSVEITNLTILTYAECYGEDGEAEEPDVSKAKELYSTATDGNTTAYYPEGGELTLQHVVDGYVRDKDLTAVFDKDKSCYIKLAEVVVEEGWFWNILVNGKEVPVGSVVKPTDEFTLIYQKLGELQL
ncbi:MAG: hypothetical protein IKD31_03590 [Clostridia bacterium]|nr:hypothetical protein [Clostridia bacterium]